MKDMLVVVKIKEGTFEKFMGFMQSDAGTAERKKFADVTKSVPAVAPDKRTFVAKIVVHNIDALHAFLDGSNPVSKPIWDEVRDSYEIYELNKING